MKEQEKERLRTLRGLDILDTSMEREFDDITKLAATICQTPIALISFVDENRQWFKSRYGLQVLETDRDISFCSHAIQEPDELMEVENTLEDERFKNNPLVEQGFKLRFYAGSPIVTDSGHALGTVCVADKDPRKLTPDQKSALRSLSRITMRLIYERSLRGLLEKNYQDAERELKEILAC